jgi:hypothetical protein
MLGVLFSCASAQPAFEQTSHVYVNQSLRLRLGEVGRIVLNLELWRIGLERAIGDSILLAIGDDFFLGVKAQPYLLPGVARTRLLHQGSTALREACSKSSTQDLVLAMLHRMALLAGRRCAR